VEEAVRRLSKQGLLVSRGPGARRRIVLPDTDAGPRALRLRILLYEPSDRKEDYATELLHRLQSAGHEAAFADKTMRELGMDAKRVARFVEAAEADAWVVVAGPRPVLEWFAEQRVAAFALFGRAAEVPLASSRLEKGGALLELIDRLVDLGHRRIVMLAREERRKPHPAFLEQLFLTHLRERGVATGPYNLPDWEDRPQGLVRILDKLFSSTPPTALILDQTMLYIASLQHLASKGILAPSQVSMACMDASEAFTWCRPGIAHIRWDSAPVIQRVVKWAEHVSRGRDDRRASATKATFVDGGSIGPVYGN
jgi:DNA-binding LacI/PurR family transcriptional regulator